MKLSQWVGILVVSISAACAGYWFHGQAENSVTFLAAQSLPQLDYLVVPESYSRIENTRQTLQGLCSRLRLEVESRLCEQGRLRLQPGGSKAAFDTQLNRIIRDLEDGMKEFQGTDQQLYVAEDLLCVLKREKQFNRWVDVYLQALYEHPMHPIVARFATEAVNIGKMAGREDEVVAGLTHVSTIPLDFLEKAKVDAALVEAKASNPLARVDVPTNALRD